MIAARAGTSLRAFELVGPGPQEWPRITASTRWRPTRLQRLVNQPIECDLVFEHACDDVAKQRNIGLGIFGVVDLAADPIGLEFDEDLLEPLAGDIHLIQRLNSRETCRGPGLAGHQAAPTMLRSFSDYRARERSAGRVAAFVALPRIGAHHRLRLVLDGQDAIAERQAQSQRYIHQSARAFVGDELEMIGLAANDAAERDNAVIKRPLARGFQLYLDRGRDFERAGNGDDIIKRTSASSPAYLAFAPCSNRSQIRS